MEEIKKKNNTNMASMSNISPEKSPREELIIITTSTTNPTWKLYENPFYNSHDHQNHHQNQTAQNQQIRTIAAKNHHHHHHNHHLQCLQLPLSARKLAASLWDLSFFRPVTPMDHNIHDHDHDNELSSARALIAELRTELERERKARKRLESANKRLVREREAVERMCEDLAREISSDKSEIARMKRDMDEERKMMRVSEVLREERVQMKLNDAKIALEEKLLEIDTNRLLGFRKSQRNHSNSSIRSVVLSDHDHHDQDGHDHHHDDNNHNDIIITSTSGGNSNNSSGCTSNSLPIFQRKLVPTEIENPHIKRGIKGFVEFPRVVRAIGTRNRQWGTKLECQKAQLRILLRQNGPIRSSSNNLIIS